MKIAFRAKAKNKLDSMSGNPLHRHDTDLCSSSLGVLRLLRHRGTVGPSEGNYSTPKTLAAFNQLQNE